MSEIREKYQSDFNFMILTSDGEHCYQVKVYDDDDLEFYKAECRWTGHLLAFDSHCPANVMGYLDPEHNIYQIFPPEKVDNFNHMKMIDLGG
jgi:hypothetical protein